MIISISGKQGGGKTKLSEGLKGYYPEIVVFKFADVLYEMHDAILDVYNKRKPANYPIIKLAKQLLPFIGTDWGRKIKTTDPQPVEGGLWVDIMKERIRLERQYEKDIKFRLENNRDKIILIDDLRFKSEFHGVDGLKIRLECDEEIRKARCSEEQWRPNALNHPSEIDLDDYVTEGKFDLVVDTGIRTADETLKIVKEYIDANINRAV